MFLQGRPIHNTDLARFRVGDEEALGLLHRHNQHLPGPLETLCGKRAVWNIDLITFQHKLSPDVDPTDKSIVLRSIGILL